MRFEINLTCAACDSRGLVNVVLVKEVVVTSCDLVQVLVADGELRLLGVVADAVGGLIAAGSDALVELVEERFSFHHRCVVHMDGVLDAVHDGGVVGDVQRISFAWVLEKVEEERGLVDGHAVAVAFVAVEVVVDGESAVALLSVL